MKPVWFVILPVAGIVLGSIIRWLFAIFQLSSAEQKAERVKQDALKEAEAQYFESLEKTIEGYQKIVSLQLESYRSSLHAFYVDEFFNE